MSTDTDEAAGLPQLDISQTRGIGEAVRRAYHGRQATVLIQNRFVVAVILPPEQYHGPETCCCKNCPWDGNHGSILPAARDDGGEVPLRDLVLAVLAGPDTPPPGLTAGSLAARTGWSRRAVRRELRELEGENRVRVSGQQGRAATWCLAGPVLPA